MSRYRVKSGPFANKRANALKITYVFPCLLISSNVICTIHHARLNTTGSHWSSYSIDSSRSLS